MTYRAFVADVWAVIGPRYALYLALVTLGGLAEGVALASAVPLLSAVGVGDGIGAATSSAVAEIALKILSALGIAPTVDALAGFVVSALLGGTILFLWQAYLTARLQSAYVYAWQSRLIRAIFAARLEYFNVTRHGDIVNAVLSETQRLSGAFYHLGLLLSGIVHGLIYLAVAVSLSLPITLIVLGGGMLLLVATRPLVHRAYRVGAKISEGSAEFQTMTADFVSGVKVLKATATEGRAATLLRKLAGRLRGYFFHHSIDIQIAKGVFDFGAALMVAGVLYAGHQLLRTDPAVALGVMAIFLRLMPKVSGIQQSLQSLSLCVPAAGLVKKMAAAAEAMAESERRSRLPDALADGAFEIRVEGVTVKYGNRLALRGVDLRVPAGSCVALVGPSGAGKSTLVDVIFGLVPPTAGHVYVNGYLVESLPLKEYRRRIGYMTQEPVLFQGTVKENILWATTNGSAQDAERALRLAAAQTIVEQLPRGIDTEIGNRGASLSGGERQRLALARALVGNPGILVLDEATSAQDAETEATVLEALNHIKGKVTILMIAHRLSSLRLADQIHLLVDGTIAESGTWSELTREGSRFRKLWTLQMQSAEGRSCC